MGDSTQPRMRFDLFIFATRARTHKMDTATYKYWDTSYRPEQIGASCLSYKQRQEEEGKGTKYDIQLFTMVSST